MEVAAFIAKWEKSSSSERANYQLFLTELAELIGAPQPRPAEQDNRDNAYVFDRGVTDPVTGGQRYVDLYKRGCFVCEAKQGSEKTPRPANPQQQELLTGIALPNISRTGTAVRGTPAYAIAMQRAKEQAHRYARAFDATEGEGAPPILMVVDVGYSIELYADFSGRARTYTQFPDARRFRITLADLHDETVRERLRLVWTDPNALDPSRISAAVTRRIAANLAELGKSFEAQKHDRKRVAEFLIRCLFTMFAEDVELIPARSFTDMLRELRGKPGSVMPMLEDLWKSMNTGGFSSALRADLKRFNGGLFKDCRALPVNEMQLGLLIQAAEADWRDVEPAIFGTLLERALHPRDRHKLGAHYTPRAYVERLVLPTVIEPLREDWDGVKAAAALTTDKGKTNEAIDLVRAFRRNLCNVRVLDPACGSGNFLYVALEQMKRLEGEVIDFLAELGDTQSDPLTVDPHQFLGLEINVWAKEVAELVLWIGYLQWHYRTTGQAAPSEPVLRDFHNIKHVDALLVLEGERARLDENGKPVTRWDGQTYKTHPATSERVPDDKARRTVLDFDKALARNWPEADFIIGNPPFIGASRIRESLGDGYAEALWKTYPKMPESADFVMFWWDKAARMAKLYDPATGKGVRRFGFITTNSLRQTFNRRVVAPWLEDRKKPLSLLFAIPDHPWVDSTDGAAVRIAMTVAGAGRRDGKLLTIRHEEKTPDEVDGRLVTFDVQEGRIFANLQTGVDVTSARPLKANEELASMGVKLHGSGFIISPQRARELGLGRTEGLDQHIQVYLNGRDILQTSRDAMVIDLFGLSETAVRQKFPDIYTHILDRVKPERDANRDKDIRENWWIFGRPRSEMRPALEHLQRYIATVETSKHCIFTFLDGGVLPDNMLIAIAIEDASALAILSSRLHVTWALAAGGTLEDRPRYNKTQCYDPFPFPDASQAQTEILRDLGERLDAHRKARQKAHPKLTLTQMYNVLERVRTIDATRSGEVLAGKEKTIYHEGQIGILKDLHDRIDVATADAYGWPHDLTDTQILERLVALNHERAAEEAAGKVRWLRPDYQNPSGHVGSDDTARLGVDAEVALAQAIARPWPKTIPQRMAAVRDVLAEIGPASAETIRAAFHRGQKKGVEECLDTLAALGQAEKGDDGLWSV